MTKHINGVYAYMSSSPLRVLDALARWHERARSRRALLTLDDRMLSDIGVSRADAHHEASTPFWRA
jgi:uncharacterized protein YjiS (DUF1127 family)